MFGKEIVNLVVSNVPWCIGNNMKTLGLNHLQIPDMGASGGPPDGARIVHQGTDVLFVQQNSFPDGETTTPV